MKVFHAKTSSKPGRPFRLLDLHELLLASLGLGQLVHRLLLGGALNSHARRGDPAVFGVHVGPTKQGRPLWRDAARALNLMS